MAKEKTYEQKIKKYLTSIGAYHVKYLGCAFTQAGVPDILACVNGRFVAIEVKAERGRPSALQLHNLKEINNAGGLALLAYPDDFEDLKALLNSPNNEALYSKFTKRFL